jgi:hypothetical protein
LRSGMPVLFTTRRLILTHVFLRIRCLRGRNRHGGCQISESLGALYLSWTSGYKMATHYPNGGRSVGRASTLDIPLQHAGNVPLIYNPSTMHVSPQYHVSFDDSFSTVVGSTAILSDEVYAQLYASNDWIFKNPFGPDSDSYLFEPHWTHPPCLTECPATPDACSHFRRKPRPLSPVSPPVPISFDPSSGAHHRGNLAAAPFTGDHAASQPGKHAACFTGEHAAYNPGEHAACFTGEHAAYNLGEHAALHQRPCRVPYRRRCRVPHQRPCCALHWRPCRVPLWQANRISKPQRPNYVSCGSSGYATLHQFTTGGLQCIFSGVSTSSWFEC